jgi:hypothetical protein
MSNADMLTPRINQQNVEAVRRQIARKTGSVPSFATNETATHVITDIDHWPYNRYFRGVYYFPEPVIMEREAGFRELNNSCYDFNPVPQKDQQPNHCFQTACSTVYPCYPEYLQKFSDKELLDTMLNRACVVQYR